MSKPFEFCLPVLGFKVPAAPEWIHEVKHDGYWRRVGSDGGRGRLITEGGHDWSKRFPWIVEAALQNRHPQFVIDGEAVVLGVDGISDFDALQSRTLDAEVQLYALDIMALNGDDLRPLPLSMRKTNLERLLRGRTRHLPDYFRAWRHRPEPVPTCMRMGLEGFLSKRFDRAYRAGRCDHWLKVKTHSTPHWKSETLLCCGARRLIHPIDPGHDDKIEARAARVEILTGTGRHHIKLSDRRPGHDSPRLGRSAKVKPAPVEPLDVRPLGRRLPRPFEAIQRRVASLCAFHYLGSNRAGARRVARRQRGLGKRALEQTSMLATVRRSKPSVIMVALPTVLAVGPTRPHWRPPRTSPP
jgi:hypothetical protein